MTRAPILDPTTRRAALLGLGAAGLSACAKRPAGPTIAFVPKFTSDPYFVSANQGAQEAARELGVRVLYNGPADANVAGQVDIVDRLVRNHVSAIAICALDPTALASSLQRAQRKGIKVSTWDADVQADARQVFLNQATYKAIGERIADIMAQGVKATGAEIAGDYLMLSGSLTASNMLAWMKAIREALAANYPGMRIAATLLGEQDIEKGKNVTINYLRANPRTKGVFTVDGSAEVSAAEAIKQLGLAPGKVTIAGIGVPNGIRPYVKSGYIGKAVLWSPVDIGYAAIHIAKAQLDGTFDPAAGVLQAGRLGRLTFTTRDELLLGPPLVFQSSNIDQYHF